MHQGHAGTMGPVSSEPSYKVTPFVSGEGVVTWHTIQSLNVYNRDPQQNFQRWGGRGAAGFLYPYSQHFQFSSEGGWGYYGRVTMNNSAASSDGNYSLNIVNRTQLYGFDLLVGALYNYNKQFDLFLKLGAMAENRTFDSHRTLVSEGITSIYNVKNTQTNIFPEIKVGGIYNINNQLGVSLAYMYVFGNERLEATIPDGSAPPSNTYITASTANPSLQSIMLGLVYKFA